ncbi:hypothetical protein Tco_0403653 [Tanacetum coccineum]
MQANGSTTGSGESSGLESDVQHPTKKMRMTEPPPEDGLVALEIFPFSEVSGNLPSSGQLDQNSSKIKHGIHVLYTCRSDDEVYLGRPVPIVYRLSHLASSA